MATHTNHNTNNIRYAVNRCYQPARIERELLAKVFGLVGRGNNAYCEPGDDDLEPTDMDAQKGPYVSSATSLFDTNSQSIIATLEDAA